MPKLQVTIVQGRNLGAAEENDLYAKIKLCATKPILGVENASVLKKYKTDRVANSRDPVWMETFTIGFPTPNQRKFSPLSLEVMDYHRFSPNSVVGHARIDISLLRRGEETAQWLQIQSDGKSNGEVFVRVLALDFNGSRTSPDAPPYTFDPSSASLPMYTPSPSLSPRRYNRPPEYEETESPGGSVASSSVEVEESVTIDSPSTPAQNIPALIAQIMELLPDVSSQQAEASLRAHHCSFERAIDAILSHQDLPEPPTNSTATGPAWTLEAPRSPGGTSARRRAVVVGCRYLSCPQRLASPPNDVQQVHRMLQLAGFEVSDDSTLVLLEGAGGPDSVPNRANIVAALGWLVADAREGDALFFHFSGHAVQLRSDDRNDGEIKFEEGLAAQDYSQGGVLLERELAEVITQLPAGVRLTMLLDTPHGGGHGLQLPVRWLDGPGAAKFRHGIFGLRPFFSAVERVVCAADVQLFSIVDENTEVAEVGYHSPAGALSCAFVACIIDAMSDVSPPSYRVLLSSLRRAMKSHGFSSRVVFHCSQLLDPDAEFRLDHITNAPLPEPELLTQVPTKSPGERHMGSVLGICNYYQQRSSALAEHSFDVPWEGGHTEEWDSTQCSDDSEDSTPMIRGAAGEQPELACLLADRISELLEAAAPETERAAEHVLSADATSGEVEDDGAWRVTEQIASQLQADQIAAALDASDAREVAMLEEGTGEEADFIAPGDDLDAEVDALSVELAQALNQVDLVLAEATCAEVGDGHLDNTCDQEMDHELAEFFGTG